jgi:hypothetical protein
MTGLVLALAAGFLAALCIGVLIGIAWERDRQEAERDGWRDLERRTR